MLVNLEITKYPWKLSCPTILTPIWHIGCLKLCLWCNEETSKLPLVTSLGIPAMGYRASPPLMLQEPNFSWDQSLAEGASPLVRPTQVPPGWGRRALLDNYSKTPASTQTADDQAASFSLCWQSCLYSCCVRKENNIESELLPFPGRFIHSTANRAHKSLSPSKQGHRESVCFPFCQCWLYKVPQ